MGITVGIPRPTGGGVGDIPASRMLGNFGPTAGPAIAVDSSQVLAWLDAATNTQVANLAANIISFAGDLVALGELVDTKVSDGDSRLANAREWIAATISQTEAEAGVATDRRAWTAERVRQAIRVTPDHDPTGNIFTIGTTATAQRIRLRRRFVGAGDFSQLSIDFSGDNCRIQTQQAGNNANPIVLGTNATDRVFIHGTSSWVGIGGMPTTRPLEIFAGTAGFRLQSSSAVSPPVYTEIARTFDFLTWQNSTSPFETFTDLVANTNQFNNHSIRVFVHTSGISAPVLSTVFHSSGRVFIGGVTDDGSSRLQLQGAMTVNGIIAAYKSLTSTTNYERFEIDTIGDPNNYRICHRPGSLGGLPRGIVLGTYNGAGQWTPWLGLSSSGYTVSQPASFRNAINVVDDSTSIYYAIALGGL